MNDEIFDVVNEQDEVIDRRPRHEVDRLGLKHRATGARGKIEPGTICGTDRRTFQLLMQVG